MSRVSRNILIRYPHSLSRKINDTINHMIIFWQIIKFILVIAFFVVMYQLAKEGQFDHIRYKGYIPKKRK